MPVPNQRTIRIPNRQIVNPIVFDKTTFTNALASLTHTEFKLWSYLYFQLQNSDIPLSKTEFVQWADSSDQSYKRAVNGLKEKGYLITTSRNNYYIFVDNPNKIISEPEKYIEPNNKISIGERRIAQLLVDNKIPFVREATFGTCLFEDTRYPARFDFWVDNSYLIEYDGEQHFTANERGWNTSDQLEKTKQHDKYKSQWCKENNIPLIRIPYTALDTLNISDLLLTSTNFKEN